MHANWGPKTLNSLYYGSISELSLSTFDLTYVRGTFTSSLIKVIYLNEIKGVLLAIRAGYLSSARPSFLA